MASLPASSSSGTSLLEENQWRVIDVADQDVEHSKLFREFHHIDFFDVRPVNCYPPVILAAPELIKGENLLVIEDCYC